MTGVPRSQTVRVLCVDDNPRVAEALRTRCSAWSGLEWGGWAANADDLVDRVKRESATIVFLDLDMPGRDALEALAELTVECDDARVIVFTAHVRRDLIDAAIDAGAWGYVSKGDGDLALFEAIEQVSRGEFALSRQVEMVWSS